MSPNSDKRSLSEGRPDGEKEIDSTIIESIIRALAERGIFAFRWELGSLPVLQGNWDTLNVQ